jgi:hypothetical protein
MVLNLDSLIGSLPAKQEEKRLQELERRRKDIMIKFPNDHVICSTKDPRGLNSVGQCMYIVRCLEGGLDKSQIVDLFFDDHFIVDTLIGILGVGNLVSKK